MVAFLECYFAFDNSVDIGTFVIGLSQVSPNSLYEIYQCLIEGGCYTFKLKNIFDRPREGDFTLFHKTTLLTKHLHKGRMQASNNISLVAKLIVKSYDPQDNIYLTEKKKEI